MSALHAISAPPNPNTDPANAPAVQLYALGAQPANNAKIWDYRPLLIPPDDNLFDLALARYNMANFAERSCIVCAANAAHPGQAYSYPGDIAQGVVTSATSTDWYHRSGASTINCGKGLCTGTGCACAVMLWGTRYLFRNCLVFEPFATDGDSGAIIVRGSD